MTGGDGQSGIEPGFSHDAEQQTANDWPSANGARWTMRHGWVQMLGPDAWAPLNALLDLFELCAVRSRDLAANAELSLVQPKMLTMVDG